MHPRLGAALIKSVDSKKVQAFQMKNCIITCFIAVLTFLLASSTLAMASNPPKAVSNESQLIMDTIIKVSLSSSPSVREILSAVAATALLTEPDGVNRYEPSSIELPVQNLAISHKKTEIHKADMQNSQQKLAHSGMQQQLSIRQEAYHYSWPCRGETNLKFSDAIIGRKNKIDHVIINTQDQQIKATSHGEVIYAKWMPDLGLTIILNHGSGYHSIYANSDRLLVKEGDKVEQGQTIAEFLGQNKQKALYFSIHHNGQAIHPKLLITSESN